MTTAILIFVGWAVGAVSAYPRNKKWRLESDSLFGDSRGGAWTNKEMIGSMLACLFLWPFVWMWFVWEVVSNSNLIERIDRWRNSEATFDRNTGEIVKKIFKRK